MNSLAKTRAKKITKATMMKTRTAPTATIQRKATEARTPSSASSTTPTTQTVAPTAPPSAWLE